MLKSSNAYAADLERRMTNVNGPTAIEGYKALLMASVVKEVAPAILAALEGVRAAKKTGEAEKSQMDIFLDKVAEAARNAGGAGDALVLSTKEEVLIRAIRNQHRYSDLPVMRERAWQAYKAATALEPE